MNALPSEMKMTLHAQQRLMERKDIAMKYNMKDLMQSPVEWFDKDDLIHDCALYRHCCYTTRKSIQMGYITDGNIEVIYNKYTNTAITILEVKDKFKPITQFIKPEILKKIKKENEKMEKKTELCIDCGKEGILNHMNICERCARRKANMKARGKEYVRYIDLPEEEKAKIDRAIEGQSKRFKSKEEFSAVIIEAPDSENYYQSKAEQTPVATHPIEEKTKNVLNPLADQPSFINILRECGCEIPEENLENVLNILVNTDKLKDIVMTIAKNENQQAMLDLEQALNVVERKLQHTWEYNGFQEIDDIKFKGFLTWRRMLKGSIFFWKKLYQTNTILEMQKAWNAYTQDPNEKVVMNGDKNKMSSPLKRFQITTESISTIFNTRRPFTRIFFAETKEDAYEIFKKWMADRQLHEDPSKTTIVELTANEESMK